MTSTEVDVIPIAVRDDMADLSPKARNCVEESIASLARRAQARTQNFMFPTPDEIEKRLQVGIGLIDTKMLRHLIEGDFELAEKRPSQANASGTAAYIERLLGFHPRLSLESLRTINLGSRSLLHDVLSVATGTDQDIGFVGADDALLQRTIEMLKDN